MDNSLRDTFLEAFEATLEAQLRAVKRLRSGEESTKEATSKRGLSQVDMAYAILKKTRSPLHVSELLTQIQQQFGQTVDRESLVSSLTKKVARHDRFQRTDKNTFALLLEEKR
jgi:hypothetical protein